MKLTIPKKFWKFKNWSTALYIIPCLFAAYEHVWLLFFLLGATCYFGLAYHLSDEKREHTIYTGCTWALLIADLLLSYLGRFQTSGEYIATYLMLALIPVALLARFYFQNKSTRAYNISRGVWHTCVALITILSICIFGL